MRERCEPLRIGIDFDDVLFDTGWLKMAMAFVLFPSPSHRLALNQSPQSLQLTPEENTVLEMILYSSINSSEDWLEDWSKFWPELLPVDGARTYVPRLSAEGNRLFVVSRRGQMGIQAAKILLERWQIGRFEGIVGVGPDKSKRLAAATFGLDVMVDDSPRVLEELDGVVAHRLLFDQPSNRNAVLGEGIIRIPDWLAVYHYIGDITVQDRPIRRSS